MRSLYETESLRQTELEVAEEWERERSPSKLDGTVGFAFGRCSIQDLEQAEAEEWERSHSASADDDSSDAEWKRLKEKAAHTKLALVQYHRFLTGDSLRASRHAVEDYLNNK